MVVENPRSAMAVSTCEGLAGLEVVEPASCVQWLFITKRGHYKDVARKSKDTNNKNGLGLEWFSCVN